MKRSIRSVCVMLVILSAAVVTAPATASAYGGGATHDTWQVGLSFNCNNPAVCGQNGTGGFWGWVEFDRSVDGTQTWGDAEVTGCSHTVGGGGAGALHSSIEIESWTIAPGAGGPQTFFISGEQTDSFQGTKVTYDISNVDTAIPAVPGHYGTSQIIGMSPPPGVAIQIQVAFRPAR